MTDPLSGAEPPELVIDCLGRPCPVPVIELARALIGRRDGAVVGVLSDDPAALVDVPAFCRMRGHTYLGATSPADGAPGGTLLTVRIGAQRSRSMRPSGA